MDWWGDRTLACWAGPGYIHFATNTYGDKGNDNFNNNVNMQDYGDDLTSWFFVHIAYSQAQRKVVAYVRYDNNLRQQEYTFDVNIQHFTPEKLVFMQGKDKYHAAFNGFQSSYKVEYGPGAFRSGFPSYLNVIYGTNPQSA